MPREFSRSQRMAEQLRRELAEIVRDEIKDPRLGFVSFTEVRMSRDLSHAVVYCSVFNTGDTQNDDGSAEVTAENDGTQRQQESIKILNRAVGFIRKQVASRIQARIVPDLKFALDDSVTRGNAMDELINRAIQSDSHHHDTTAVEQKTESGQMENSSANTIDESK